MRFIPDALTEKTDEIHSGHFQIWQQKGRSADPKSNYDYQPKSGSGARGSFPMMNGCEVLINCVT